MYDRNPNKKISRFLHTRRDFPFITAGHEPQKLGFPNIAGRAPERDIETDMVKRQKRKAKVEESEEEEGRREEPKGLKASVAGESEDDDEVANEDLTLKIVEKAMLSRVAILAQGKNGIVLDENVALPSEAIKSKRKKKKRNVKTEVGDQSVMVLKVEESVETVEKSEAAKVAKLVEPRDGNTKLEAVEAADLVVEPADGNADEFPANAVLRKLLRGPRYFDPPDSGWATCYNCGEEGHMAVNCTLLERKKKPCFVCGDLDHQGKQCPKGKDCFICKKGGHRAKDCPEKGNGLSNNLKMCLKCGESGHDLFSCRNDYFPDDLKEIQCYVCKRTGHICCVKFVDNSPRVISCYRCGEQGHNGFACSRIRGEGTNATPSSCYKCGEGGHFACECTNTAKACSRVREEDTNATPSSCYKCGEGGHFARECTNTAKRNRELSSTPALRVHKSQNQLGSKSAPQEFGKTCEKEIVKYKERGNLTPQKRKKRGGWVPEDNGDSYELKPEVYHLESPSSPYGRYTISHLSYGNNGSSARSSKIIHASNLATSVFQGLGTASQQGFSSTRFSSPGATHGAGCMFGNPTEHFQYPGGELGYARGIYGHPGRTYGHSGSTYRQPVHTYGNPGVYHGPVGMHGNSGSALGNASGVYGNNSNWIRRNKWWRGNNYQRF